MATFVRLSLIAVAVVVTGSVTGCQRHPDPAETGAALAVAAEAQQTQQDLPTGAVHTNRAR